MEISLLWVERSFTVLQVGNQKDVRPASLAFFVCRIMSNVVISKQFRLHFISYKYVTMTFTNEMSLSQFGTGWAEVISCSRKRPFGYHLWGLRFGILRCQQYNNGLKNFPVPSPMHLEILLLDIPVMQLVKHSGPMLTVESEGNVNYWMKR